MRDGGRLVPSAITACITVRLTLGLTNSSNLVSTGLVELRFSKLLYSRWGYKYVSYVQYRLRARRPLFLV
jgi:hypothetical protein